nr:helix-turn-helix domain-containing protein [Actinomadura sp. RB99]
MTIYAHTSLDDKRAAPRKLATTVRGLRGRRSKPRLRTRRTHGEGGGVSSARPRGPYAKTAARRADIVRAARDGFAEYGFARSSLRDIAERADITHTGLLQHFRHRPDHHQCRLLHPQ